MHQNSVAPIHKFLGGQHFLWRGEKFLCAVMPKASYQHPLLKSIHVLKCTKAWYRVEFINSCSTNSGRLSSWTAPETPESCGTRCHRWWVGIGVPPRLRLASRLIRSRNFSATRSTTSNPRLLERPIRNMPLFKDNHWTSLLYSPSRMWNAWSRILQRKPAVSIPSQRGSSRNSSSTWLHSSLAFSTGRYCKASSRRISVLPRWRQFSRSLPSIRLCSAATGPSRTCRLFRRCLNGPSTSGCFCIFTRTVSFRNINLRIVAAIPRRPPSWR